MTASIAPTAQIESEVTIGEGTRIWDYVHLRTGAAVGVECVIGRGAFIDAGVTIGDHTKVQNNALLYAPATIGSGVFIGPAAILTNDRHPRSVNPDLSVKTVADWIASGVSIRDGASIGAGAIIVAGSTIAEWAMVAAGAVVASSVRRHELVGGVPARHLGWVGCDGARMKQDQGQWVDSDGARYELGPDGLVEVER